MIYGSENGYFDSASEHGRPGQFCGMLPVPENNLSSMIYLSSNGLSGPKQTKKTLNCKQ
jgi:hypothetical protein